MRLILILILILKTAIGTSLFAESHKHENEQSEHKENEGTEFTIADSELSTFGLTLKEIGAAKVTEGVKGTGKIIPIDYKFTHAAARFPGVIKEVNVKVGDIVEAGNPLATVQNNQNLQTFTLTSSHRGVIIERHATLGENVSETESLFVIADLSEVWAEVAIERKDVSKVRVGQKVWITVSSSSAFQQGEISFIAPITDEATQSTFARAKLINSNSQFPPGAFIRATIVTSETEVPLAIEKSAIEEVNGESTVFVRRDDSFEPHKVISGRSDELMTEILGGIEKGEVYVVGNTEILKQFVGNKDGHSHEEEAEHKDEHKHGHGEHEEEEEHGEEGHIRLSSEAIKNAGIAIETIGPVKLQMKINLNGEILSNIDKLAHVTPRFPGIIKETRKNVGDSVAQGEILAVIESNLSVQSYEIRSPISGSVLEKHSTIGEFATGLSPIFVIGDLTEVWIDLIVPEKSASLVKPGQTILIAHTQDNQTVLQGALTFLSPVVDETTQSRFARAVIKNKEGHLSPGAFVSGELIVEEFAASLAAKNAGIQNIDGKAVVFVEDKEGVFEKREIVLGREDGTYSEVLNGLKLGEKYIATNSFLLKAELGKSEAQHEH